MLDLDAAANAVAMALTGIAGGGAGQRSSRNAASDSGGPGSFGPPRRLGTFPHVTLLPPPPPPPPPRRGGATGGPVPGFVEAHMLFHGGVAAPPPPPPPLPPPPLSRTMSQPRGGPMFRDVFEAHGSAESHHSHATTSGRNAEQPAWQAAEGGTPRWRTTVTGVMEPMTQSAGGTLPYGPQHGPPAAAVLQWQPQVYPAPALLQPSPHGVVFGRSCSGGSRGMSGPLQRQPSLQSGDITEARRRAAEVRARLTCGTRLLCPGTRLAM